MCANSEGSGETARMHRLAWAFAGRLSDKDHNLMSWLKTKKKNMKRQDEDCQQSDQSEVITVTDKTGAVLKQWNNVSLRLGSNIQKLV